MFLNYAVEFFKFFIKHASDWSFNISVNAFKVKCLKLVSEIHVEADNTALQFENVCFRNHLNLFASFQFIETFPNQILFG